MKKAFIALMAGLLYASTSFAQSDSLKTEIGFSTHFIFNYLSSSGFAPYELMLKQQVGKNSWLRYGLSASFITSNTNNIPGLDKAENSHTSLKATVGLEKRKTISTKWLVLYGADLQASYSKSDRFTVSTSTNGNSSREYDYQSTMYGGGLRPFVGIGFNITPRLYISTEASLFVSAEYGKSDSRQISYDPQTESMVQKDEQEDLWRSAAGLSPASAIFVYYRF